MQTNGNGCFAQQLIDIMPDGFFLYDVSTQACVYVNRRFVTSVGLTQEEINRLGTKFLQQLVHPDDFSQFAERIEQLATTSEKADVAETEYRIRHANGEWRWFHTLCTVCGHTPEGGPQQVLGVARDITERKRMETALVESETLAAMGRLAARLAHEINNPLASIKNALLLIRRIIPANHPDAKYLDWTEKELDRIVQVMRQLLTMGREDSRRDRDRL